MSLLTRTSVGQNIYQVLFYNDVLLFVLKGIMLLLPLPTYSILENMLTKCPFIIIFIIIIILFYYVFHHSSYDLVTTSSTTVKLTLLIYIESFAER